MFYNLEFKRNEKEQGYWNVSISAENEEEAIQKAKQIIEEENYKKAKLTKIIYREKVIHRF